MASRSFSIELHLEDTFDAAELAVRNNPDEINRLLIHTNEDTSKAIFKTSLQQVSYGHLPDGAPAALIVFQSEFLLTSRNRIKHAVICLALADTLAPTDPQKAPQIVEMAPLWRQGSPATRRTSSTTSTGASLGAPLSSMGTNHRRDTTTERHQTGHTQIRGIITSHHPRKHPRVLNRAIWNIEENAVQRAGIPPLFRGAILVRYDERAAFQMAFEVEVVQGFAGFAGSMLEFLRKSERGRDDPVCFAPGEAYPAELGGERDFGDVDLEELVEPPGPRGVPGS